MAVLYTYSDCTLLRSAAGRASSAYGWLSAGCADKGLVKEVSSDGSGHWHLSQTESEWDLNTLEEGTRGGGVIDGPNSYLTTFRGEVFGLLATLQYVEVGGWAARVQHRLDNEAVVTKFNKDRRLVTAYQGCVHADSDLWIASYLLNEELGSRVQLVWQRSHLEQRLAKAQ